MVTAWATARAIGRGLLAVLVLLVTAADALLTAWLGVPPLALAWRRARAAMGEAYRDGYWDHPVDAEEVTDPADVAEDGTSDEKDGGA